MAAPISIEGHGVLRAGEDAQVDSGEVREELGRVGEVGLRDHEEGTDAGVERRDEVTVDEALPRLRIGRRDDDQHLIGIGDDHAFHLVGVVGAPTQEGGALLDADDAAQRPLVARQIAHHAGAIPVDDRLLAQLARTGREDPALVGAVLVDEHGVPTAIHTEHPRDPRVRVRRPALRPRAVGLRVGSRPDRRLVESEIVVVVVGEPAHASAPFMRQAVASAPSIFCHRAANWGRVFAVVPMSSICTPGTRRPIRAPVVARR